MVIDYCRTSTTCICDSNFTNLLILQPWLTEQNSLLTQHKIVKYAQNVLNFDEKISRNFSLSYRTVFIIYCTKVNRLQALIHHFLCFLSRDSNPPPQDLQSKSLPTAPQSRLVVYDPEWIQLAMWIHHITPL